MPDKRRILHRCAARSCKSRHDSVRLADVVVQAIVRDEIEPPHVPFIESRDFFFLSTVSASGEPTVSYKGGAPGLVKVARLPDPGLPQL
jgi:predicted pyridoxine 5'-phosphate oxidase superfamily flavin-nucleotide-binding protein